MKTKFALALLSVCLIAVCIPSFGQKLYPVSGPLASQTPPPVFSGQSRNPMFSIGSLKTSSGSITWTLAHGEKLQGKLITPEVTASAPVAKALGDPAGYPPQSNLAFAWDAVYGQGYYVARIMGKKIWQGVFTGDQGTVLQVEMYEEVLNKEVDKRFSVAVDNKGNIYKVVW